MKFFVPGVPRPKGSKTKVGGKLIEVADMGTRRRRSGSLKSWMEAVAHAAVVFRDCQYRAETPLAVQIVFYVPRPKSVKRRRPCAKSGGDVDKLARACLDALEGVIYENDAQVVDLRAIKRYECDSLHGPGAKVSVEAL